MSNDNGSLEAVIQKRLETDTSFQESLKNPDLSDDQKKELTDSKRKELIEAEYTDLSAKAAEGSKNADIAKDQKRRAEIAEEALKKAGGDKKPDDLSSDDLYRLMTAKVHQDDVKEVRDYAKLKGVSIEEAMKSPVILGIIRANEEQRKSADAARTRGGKRQDAKDGDSIVESIKTQGEAAVPEKGSAEATALFKKRHPNFKG